MSAPIHVIPAQAGIQGSPGNARCAFFYKALDSRLRGNDAQRTSLGEDFP